MVQQCEIAQIQLSLFDIRMPEYIRRLSNGFTEGRNEMRGIEKACGLCDLLHCQIRLRDQHFFGLLQAQLQQVLVRRESECAAK